MCSQPVHVSKVNVNRKGFYYKGFTLLTCLQLQTQPTALSVNCLQIFCTATLCFSSRGRSCASFILRMSSSVLTFSGSFVISTPHKRSMYYLFLFVVLKCFEYLVHVCCGSEILSMVLLFYTWCKI